MAIKIVKAGEPIKVTTAVALILGVPGIGKTTLANSAEKPLLLDYDEGSHRSLNRPDTVRISSWKEIEELSAEDVEGYRTLIVDTVGRCLDHLINDIVEREPSLATAGTLKIQGYGRLKTRFISWLRMIRGYGLNVVLIAHAVEEKHGDDVKLRVDGAGSGKEEVYKLADMMCRVNSRGGKRYVDWDPSDSGFGKNPGGLPAEELPNAKGGSDYLHKAIATTLSTLSQANVESNEEEQRLLQLRTHFEESLDGPEEFTKLARSMAETDAAMADRSILVKVAKERGYKLDKKTLTFTDPKAGDGEEEENRERFLTDLRKALERMCSDPEDFTKQAKQMGSNNARKDEKQVLVEVAEAKGFVFDRKKGEFVKKEEGGLGF